MADYEEQEERDAKDNDPIVQEFRSSVLGIVDALNTYREAHGKPALEASRVLNFDAYHRAEHFIQSGVGEGSLWESVSPLLPSQDRTDGVELYSQWANIEKPTTYLSAWIQDEESRKLLLGDFGYVGIMGDTIPVKSRRRPFMTAVIVLVMTRKRPGR